MFCEILVDGLLRGNITARYRAYNIGRNAGFLSVNDIRGKENMNSIGKKGDIYLEPLNMKPAGTETPVKDAGNNSDDNTRDAHFNLIKNQWLRVIRTHTGTIKKGKYDPVPYALTVMADPVNALISLGSIEINAKEVIRDVTERFINISDTETPDEHAYLMASETILKIGGNHAR